MNAQPLVSILMPAYNCAKFINKAIDSVINQTYTNWELLIADDCSTDTTSLIAESYKDPRIKFHHNTQNMGYLQTCNKLMALAKGDLITFQDADDYSAPNRFEMQVKHMQENSLGACGTNYMRVDEDGNELSCSCYLLKHDEIFNASPQYYYFVGASVMFTKEVYQKVGGYNLYFDRIGAEDLYWVRLIMEQVKFENIKDPMYYYRFNPASISGNLSDNPKGLFSAAVVQKLIEQRNETGTDDLEQGRTAMLDAFISKSIEPFLKDYSIFLKTLALRNFYNGDKKKAIRYMWKAIQKKPFNITYYKDLLYFIRK
jgi:glycosyltransferase involved in cell wall biosynthesis